MDQRELSERASLTFVRVSRPTISEQANANLHTFVPAKKHKQKPAVRSQQAL
jgi:hypothetical protein